VTSGPRQGSVDFTGADDLLAEYATTRDPAMRDQIVEAYYPLAYHLAMRFRNRGESIEDLAQVAALAMVKAVDRFDPTRGLKFSSFAVPTVLGELKRHFRDRAWAVRVPRRLKDLRVTMTAEISELGHQLGRSPTIAEIAERLGVPEETVIEVLEAGAAFQTESLNAPSFGGEDASTDTGWVAGALAVHDARIEAFDDHDAVRRLLETLPERERTIVYLRFYEGLTQSQIAAQVGVSQMHVSRLLQRGIAQLRTAARAAERRTLQRSGDQRPAAVPAATVRAADSGCRARGATGEGST